MNTLVTFFVRWVSADGRRTQLVSLWHKKGYPKTINKIKSTRRSDCGKSDRDLSPLLSHTHSHTRSLRLSFWVAAQKHSFNTHICPACVCVFCAHNAMHMCVCVCASKSQESWKKVVRRWRDRRSRSDGWKRRRVLVVLKAVKIHRAANVPILKFTA